MAGGVAAVAGAMLRDLPGERLEPARAALLPLAEAAGVGEPLLALAAGPRARRGGHAVSRVLIASDGEARVMAPRRARPRGELAAGLDELPGRPWPPCSSWSPPPSRRRRRWGARRRRGAPAAPPPDVVDLLYKLGDLRDAGVLTEEFAAKIV